MIKGIGTDIIEIERIKKAVERKGFLLKYFSEDERLYFNERKNNPQTIAGNFCAKEAFSKALGTGVRGFSLNEVEVLRDEQGCPYIKLSGSAKAICDNMGVEKILVSISHCQSYATAFVTLEE